MYKKFVSNYKFYAAVISFIYLFLVIFSTLFLTFSNPLINPLKQFAAAIIIGVLFAVVFLYLSDLSAASYRYVSSISSSEEAPAFKAINNSLVAMLASIIAVAFLNVFRLPSAGVFYTFLSVSVHLISAYLAIIFFYFIGQSGVSLARLTGQSKVIRRAIPFIIIVFCLLSVAAWPIIVNSPFSDQPQHILSFLAPALFLTLVYVPMFAAWIYGLAGTIGIYLYARHVQGSIYRSFFSWLAGGLVLVTLTSIVRQMSSFAYGLTGQEHLLAELPRALLVLGMAIGALAVMRHGFIKLIEIEEAGN